MNSERKQKALQFLRFPAFLGVFFLHAFPNGARRISLFVLARAAFFSVSFFIVLSGFVSALRPSSECLNFSLRKIVKYLWKKLKQFYPLYILLLTMRFLYHLFSLIRTGAEVQGRIQFVQFIRCALLIETWISHDYFILVGAAWFMSVIFFMYVLKYPLLTMINRIQIRFERKGLVILLLWVATCDFLMQYLLHRNPYTANPEYWNYVFPPARIGEYFTGMIMCRLMIPYLNRKCKRKSGLWTMLEILTLFMPFLMMSILRADEWMLRAVIWMIPSLIIVAVFSLQRGSLSQIFSRKSLVFLGDIEFECYLLHEACLLITSHFLGTGTVGSMLTGLALTILLSSFLYEWKGRREHRKVQIRS